MFDPVTGGAGLALNIVGGMISRAEATKNANAQAAARNAALTQYLQKQAALSDEGRGYLNTNVDKYAPGNTQLPDAQDNRTGVITKTVGQMSDPNAIPTTRGAPPAVRGEIAKRMLEAFNRSTDHAKAMGKVGGYGDQWFNNNIDINDTNRKVGTLNNFARGNASILQSQQDLAEIGATRQPSLWGPILQAGGQFALGAAGRGGFDGGGRVGSTLAHTQYAAAFPTPIGSYEWGI